MKLQSRFNCHQQVWHRFIGSKEVRTKCPACDGSGDLAAKNGTSQSCRECFGHGYTSEWISDIPVVNGPYTIGQIKIEYTAKSEKDSDFSNYGKQKESTVIQYMMHETGVGSGCLYYEESLFATKDEAEASHEEENK